MESKILLTGAQGFLGANLSFHLLENGDHQLYRFDTCNTSSELRDWVAEANVVYHLAGVNRPDNVDEFQSGNAGFTGTLIDAIRDAGSRPHVVFSSSVQASMNNPYGASKRRGEEILTQFSDATGCRVSIFRLKNIFGKWCRPNYNSVVATFCHNIANDLPVEISDPDRELELV